jgi:3-hydroxybutyryl-CoA dehydrogenase
MSTPAGFDTLAVIGNGIISDGVSEVYAVRGNDVVMIGRSRENLGRAMDNIRPSLDDLERHGLVTS